MVAVVFLLLLVVAALAGFASWYLAGGYLLLSLVTFLLYAVDKSAARRGERRIPERTLHLMALCGGWPGAALAQQRVRHKTAKKSFLWVFRATVVLNLAALGYLAFYLSGRP